MSQVFADTFYYLALLNPNDEAHERTLAWTDGFSGNLVTTEWVLTELADGLSGARTRAGVIAFLEAHRRERGVRIIASNRSLLARGWQLYRKRPDKEWSLTDCVSFEVMRARGLRDALTGDHHFEQAGFRAIFK